MWVCGWVLALRGVCVCVCLCVLSLFLTYIPRVMGADVCVCVCVCVYRCVGLCVYMCVCVCVFPFLLRELHDGQA